jgi:hypothetical protein
MGKSSPTALLTCSGRQGCCLGSPLWSTCLRLPERRSRSPRARRLNGGFERLYAFELVAVRVLSIKAGSRTGAVLLALFAAALCLLAIPATSFASSAPSIGSTSAEVGQNEATLKAPIRPEGLATNYEIWLQCTSQSCTSTEGQRVAEGSIEAGRLEQEVSVALTSLEWDSSYIFEVIASNKDGTARSYPQTFTTGSPPPPGCPDGCSDNKPAEFKAEPWNEEGAAREADEAPRLEEEREAKAKEEAERPAKEAAARAAKEREVHEAGERAGRETAEREAKKREEEKAAAARSVRCVVPKLKGDSLVVARSALGKAHCSLGKVSRPHERQRKLVVSAQSVRAGRQLAKGTAVAVRLGPARG